MNNVQVRKRKGLVMLPMLIVPFITLAFWALGGGQQDNKEEVAGGLNVNLPDSSLLQDKLLDKLGFYKQAEKDSMKLAEWMRTDPYYRQRLAAADSVGNELQQFNTTTPQFNGSPYAVPKQEPEAALLQKLAKLQTELNKQTTMSMRQTDDHELPPMGAEADRLEAMMQQIGTNAEDPQIGQLSNVMDKILDVQHPERIKERQQEKQISPTELPWPIFTQSPADTGLNGFFSTEATQNKFASNAIEAVMHEPQTLVNGSIIKLRILQDMYINNEKIPTGTFLFGTVQLDAERLLVTVSSIRSHQSIYNVKLDVHDMDGLPGIHIPGAISRDVAKQSADNSVQLMELSTVDPSLRAQAAGAGLNALRTLLSRKAKLIKVKVKAGYKLLLVDKSKL
jgi:conjugative transposon TraM protein